MLGTTQQDPRKLLDDSSFVLITPSLDPIFLASAYLSYYCKDSPFTYYYLHQLEDQVPSTCAVGYSQTSAGGTESKNINSKREFLIFSHFYIYLLFYSFPQ